MIEKGTYKAKAITGALGKAGTGKEQVGIEFALTDGSGNTIWWYGFFTPDALPVTLRALRACGWEGDDLSDLAGIDAHEINLVIEHEEYPRGSGEIRAKVKWVNSGDGVGMKEQLAPDAAKAFAAQMKGRILALNAAKPNGAGTKKAAPPPREPGSDDEVPEWAR